VGASRLSRTLASSCISRYHDPTLRFESIALNSRRHNQLSHGKQALRARFLRECVQICRQRSTTAVSPPLESPIEVGCLYFYPCVSKYEVERLADVLTAISTLLESGRRDRRA
jgi:hypothetical protein